MPSADDDNACCSQERYQAKAYIRQIAKPFTDNFPLFVMNSIISKKAALSPISITSCTVRRSPFSCWMTSQTHVIQIDNSPVFT